MPDVSARRVSIAPIRRAGAAGSPTDQDLIAAEAPLAVRLAGANGRRARPLGILMRTPGDDADLVRGLLYTEGVVRDAADVVAVTSRPARGDAPETLRVTLSPAADLDRLAGRAQRATSACGLCGRLEMVRAGRAEAAGGARARLPAATISALPDRLRRAQPVFAETGGLHAAGLFDPDGTLRLVREDVGRHNAVDKVVGAALAAGWLPLHHGLLAVTGRAAFEIVHKAAVAGFAAVVAVGAPTSLAVEAARAAGLTLVGFARGSRFNVYAGGDAVIWP